MLWERGHFPLLRAKKARLREDAGFVRDWQMRCRVRTTPPDEQGPRLVFPHFIAVSQGSKEPWGKRRGVGSSCVLVQILTLHCQKRE